MKLIYHILIIVLLAFNSCSELLKEAPEYSLNGQTVFLSKNSAQMALNACYGYTAGVDAYGLYLTTVTEGASGICWARYRDTDVSHFASQRFSPDDLRNSLAWEGLYKIIAECNSFIVNVENSEIAEKQHMAAQAKFLRGLAYYNLVYLYGGVPLRIGASNSGNIHMARSSKEKVLEQIVDDFTAAALTLNDKETDTSIPSKISAYAMMAKVYFYMASGEGEDSSYWQKAQEAGAEVFRLAGNVLPLEPKFAQLFNENTTESVESIFKLNYSMNGLGWSQNRLSWIFSPPGSTANGENYGERWITKSFFNYFRQQHPNDPRIDASFFHTSYVRANGNTTTIYPTRMPRNNYAWPYLKKHFDSRQVGNYGGKTFFVYRYADFLLLMADVENELGNKAKAVEYINQVYKRARNSISPASVTPADLTTTLSKEELRQIIFDERLFELNQEGHSFMDSRRRGYDFFKPILERHNADPDTRSSFGITETYVDAPMPENESDIRKVLLMPIPTKEINTNDKISINNQNPGYFQ